MGNSRKMQRFQPTHQSSFDLVSVPLHQVGDAIPSQGDFERFTEDIEWKELAGARIAACDRDWATVVGSRKVCGLAAVCVAYESTNSWLSAQRPKGSAAKMSDLAWPQASPATAVRQYYGGLLNSGNPS